MARIALRYTVDVATTKAAARAERWMRRVWDLANLSEPPVLILKAGNLADVMGYYYSDRPGSNPAGDLTGIERRRARAIDQTVDVRSESVARHGMG